MRQKHICLSCGHTDFVIGEKKEDFQDVIVCPVCKEGAYVDLYKRDTLLQKISKTKGMTIQLEDDNKNIPLLVIEVKDINSVPVVTYNGELIEKKMKVAYTWETAGLKHGDCLIEMKQRLMSKGKPIINTIKHETI